MTYILLAFIAYVAAGFYYAGSNAMVDLLWPVAFWNWLKERF